MDEMLIKLYERVFVVVQAFLKEAAPSLKIEIVEQLNEPTIDDMVKTLRELQSIISALGTDSYAHLEMRINSLQCAVVMERIAKSAINKDQEEFERCVQELENLERAPRLS